MNNALDEFIKDGKTNEQIAAAIVQAVISRKLSAQSILPIIAAEVGRKRRHAVRDVEHEVDADIRAGVSPAIAMKKHDDAKSHFLGQGHVLVHWLDATAEDHLYRARHQRMFAASVTVDAERHEAAAKQIEDNGVTCLRDLLLVKI